MGGDRGSMDQDDGFRQALALAIVGQKRRQARDLKEAHENAARVTAELEAERAVSAELRQAATRLAAAEQQCRRRGMQLRNGSSGPLDWEQEPLRDWLPPLPVQGGFWGADAPAAAGGPEHVPLPVGALEGKAQTLCGMLLSNVRLLRLLRGGGLHGSGASSGSACAAAEVAEFVAGTLLRAPDTALSAAYMRSSASALAACLSPDPHGGAGLLHGRGDSAVAWPCGAADGLGADGAALAVVQALVDALFEAWIPTSIEASSGSGGSGGGGNGSGCAGKAETAGSGPAAPQPDAQQRGARCMLQALREPPSTGAVLLCGCARHLQRLCTCMEDLHVAVGAAWGLHGAGGGTRGPMKGLSSGGGSSSGGYEAALEAGSALFEASNELLSLWQVRTGRPGDARRNSMDGARNTDGLPNTMPTVGQHRPCVDVGHCFTSRGSSKSNLAPNPTAQQALCTERLPAWAPALSATTPTPGPGAAAGAAAAGLLPPLLADAAAALLAAHAAAARLEGPCPLLAEGVCAAASQLAAALQHIAAEPGLCVGPGGPALRGGSARLCVALRDAFMPAAAGAAARQARRGLPAARLLLPLGPVMTVQ
jgi:hypothetical protein